jgi:hypothetical protein
MVQGLERATNDKKLGFRWSAIGSPNNIMMGLEAGGRINDKQGETPDA